MTRKKRLRVWENEIIKEFENGKAVNIFFKIVDMVKSTVKVQLQKRREFWNKYSL